MREKLREFSHTINVPHLFHTIFLMLRIMLILSGQYKKIPKTMNRDI